MPEFKNQESFEKIQELLREIDKKEVKEIIMKIIISSKGDLDNGVGTGIAKKIVTWIDAEAELQLSNENKKLQW